MRKITIFLLLCVIAQAAGAQSVSRRYKDKPMSKVLVDLRRATNRYKISFIHNELEDYTVTKQIEHLPIPNAIQECIGFYPIQMKVIGDSLIFVEALQKQGERLIGRVVDSKRQPIAYANIQLIGLTDTTQISSGVSNENGDFVIPTTERQLAVRISCVGYETQVLHCEVGNIGNITLKETTEHIGEVVVEGALHRAKQDRDVYLPNQRQRNAANSGLSLLDNLMIPQLDVNRMTGEVKSLVNKGITFCIDERIVDKSELEQIRPKDVLRVEYIDMPSGKFADKDLVINFVMRHYDYGGYVEAKSSTRLPYTNGENRVQAKIDHKRMSYVMLLGSGYANDHGVKTEKEEDFDIGQTFHKSTSAAYDHRKEWKNYAAVRATYTTDRLNLSGTAGITKDTKPDCGFREQIQYSGDVSDKHTAQSTEGSSNTSAYLFTNVNWNLTAKQQFVAQAYLNFGHNSYDNTYTESDGYDIDSHTKERTFSIQGDVAYVNRLDQHNSLMLRVIEYYRHYTDHYRGTLSANQHASQSETIVWPVYVYKPNNKWMFNFRPLGFSVAYWKTQANSQAYVSSRGSVTAKWSMDKQNSLTYSLYLGNSNPDAASRSEVEQIVSRYEVLRGNPDLEKVIFSTNMIDYSLMHKNWQLTAHAEYERLDNMTIATYTPEDGRLVHSYGNDGCLHNLSLGLNPTLFLLNRNLQLRGSLVLERNILTGRNGATQNHVDCSLSTRYTLGNWSLGAYYKSPVRSLQNIYYRETADYGISATYGNKGFYAEAGARRMFLHNVHTHSYFSYDHYNFDTRNYSDKESPWVYVRLSYSFDFGRKTSRQNMEAGSSAGSAILHK